MQIKISLYYDVKEDIKLIGDVEFESSKSQISLYFPDVLEGDEMLMDDVMGFIADVIAVKKEVENNKVFQDVIRR